MIANVCLSRTCADIIRFTIPSRTAAQASQNSGKITRMNTYVPMGANFTCTWIACSRASGVICAARELVSNWWRIMRSQPTCCPNSTMKTKETTMTRMSGAQKPGRAATSAKVLAGSKNTPVSREASPKPWGWGSCSGKSSGVILGPIVLHSPLARLTALNTMKGELHQPEGNTRPMSTDPSPPDDFASLYRRAFQEHGARALWSTRLLEVPTPEDALVVDRALRIEGNRAARVLAERIEQACRAAL